MKLLSLNKNLWLIGASIIIQLFLIASDSPAEVIELRNEEKTFGDWKVYCEIDDMMSSAHCKIASRFYDNSSVISLQPTNRSANQFFIIIPKIKIGSFAKIRVDKYDVILSNNIAKKDFGLLPLNSEQKDILFNQMKHGDFLYLRFNISDAEKEITVKFNLQDFKRALAYYNQAISAK